MSNLIKNKLPNILIMLFAMTILIVIPYVVTDIGTEKFGSRFLPLLASVLIIVLSILSLFEKDSNENNDEDSRLTKQGFIRILSVLIAMIAWFLLVPWLGFTITTILFTAVVMYIIGSRKIWHLIVMPLILTVAIYYIFNELLMVILPTGVFF